MLFFLNAIGQKRTEAEKIVESGTHDHAIRLSKALKKRNPLRVKRIYYYIDSNSIFPPKSLLQFKNLEYIQVISINNKHLIELKSKSPGKILPLKFDTASLFQFSQLKYLKIVGIDLSSFPTEICYLSNLKSLSLSVCNINSLPKEISHLKSLEALELRINNLNTLPEEITQLDSLKLLDLTNNSFTTIPPEILMLLNIEYVYFYNTESPYEIIDRGPGNFSIHINKINYNQNSLYHEILKLPHFNTFYFSTVGNH